MTHKFILPLYGVTKGSAISISWYRNAHYQKSNNAKIKFKKMIAPQLEQFDPIQGKVKIKATKKIKVGDEVFLSYGASYFTHGQGTTHTTKKNKIKI